MEGKGRDRREEGTELETTQEQTFTNLKKNQKESLEIM